MSVNSWLKMCSAMAVALLTALVAGVSPIVAGGVERWAIVLGAFGQAFIAMGSFLSTDSGRAAVVKETAAAVVTDTAAAAAATAADVTAKG